MPHHLNPKIFSTVSGKRVMEALDLDAAELRILVDRYNLTFMQPPPPDRPARAFFGRDDQGRITISTPSAYDFTDEELADLVFVTNQIVQLKAKLEGAAPSELERVKLPADKGPKLRANQQDRHHVREAVEKLLARSGHGIRSYKELREHPEIYPHARAYTEKTFKRWVQDIVPEDIKSPGAPEKI